MRISSVAHHMLTRWACNIHFPCLSCRSKSWRRRQSNCISCDQRCKHCRCFYGAPHFPSTVTSIVTSSPSICICMLSCRACCDGAFRVEVVAETAIMDRSNERGWCFGSCTVGNYWARTCTLTVAQHMGHALLTTAWLRFGAFVAFVPQHECLRQRRREE